VPLGTLTQDLSEMALQMASSLMLAQAMEIFTEKAMADKISLVNLAKVACWLRRSMCDGAWAMSLWRLSSGIRCLHARSAAGPDNW